MNLTSHRNLLHVFSTFKVGGPQRRFANLVGALGHKFSHSIISMDDRWDAWDLLPSHSKVNRIDFNHVNGNSFRSIFSARNLLANKQPDLLVTYNWGSIEWAVANSLPARPHVHIEDGFRPDEILTRKKRRNLFRRLVLNRKSKVVVVSKTLKVIALEEWKLSPKRVEFIPNGVNIDRFRTPQNPIKKDTLGFTEEDIVIGTIAALRPEKDLVTLIHAFAHLPVDINARLVIGGSGPTLQDLQNTANTLGLSDRVMFTGHTDSPEDLYAAFDIFALSSKTEQMPLSILEAMAARLPIASLDVGDVSSMVATSNLPYVVEGDQTALTEVLASLARSTETRSQLGKDNQEKAISVYAEEVMVSKYERLFNETAAAG